MTTTQPYLSRQVTFIAQGQRIGGLVYVPRSASSAPAPLVICCHGMEGSHTRVAPMARRFAAAGAVAVCFDFRGGGRERITALALWYPALRLGENLRAAFRTLAAVPEEFDWAGTRLGRAYAVDGWNLEVGAELASYRRPVLIVHGDQDRSVPIEVSRAAARTLPDAELVTIPGAAHGFGDANWEEAIRRTTDFLAWNGVLEED